MNSDNPLARDRISQVYLGQAGDEFSQTKSRARIDWLTDQVLHSSVLDIGCSEGILPILLGRKGIDVLGIDINPESIEYANQLLAKEEGSAQEHVRFQCVDFLNAQWENSQTYDYVILGEVIEHFAEPWILIDRAIGLIKPEGTLIVTTPFGYFPDPDHRSTFTLESFIKTVRNKIKPVSLEVVDGYIRFKGQNLASQAQDWNDLDQSILARTEQGLLSEQKRYLEMVTAIRGKNKDLTAENANLTRQSDQLSRQSDQLSRQYTDLLEKDQTLTNQYQELLNAHQKLTEQHHQMEIKYRGLIARYKIVTNSLSYQLGQQVRSAIRPPRLKPILLLPISVTKLTWNWARQKSLFMRVKNKLTPLLHPSYRPFDAQQQEEDFQNQLSRFIKMASAAADKPVVIISCTTKRMGAQKRLNRPMAFAQELARLNIPVLYVYYRWKPSDDTDPAYDGSCLLQFPNDLFHKSANQIASGIKNPNKLFLISIPDAPSVSEVGIFRLKGWKIGYEVRDEWSEFNKAGVGNWYDPTFEMYLSINADFVTTVSNRLQEKMLEFGAAKDSTYIIPNGLNGNFMDMAKPTFDKRRAGYMGKGTIGYFGHLTEKWFNWDLLLATANQHPEWNFEIIGFDAPKLNLPKNVTLLGEKTHAEIIEIARNWSLTIIPFKNNELARAVDPIKLYEYLALGLPCVSCLMDQIKGYPFTFIYEDDKNFASTIQTALAYQPSQEEWQSIQKFVLDNTWKSRVMQTLKISGVYKSE